MSMKSWMVPTFRDTISALCRLLVNPRLGSSLKNRVCPPSKVSGIDPPARAFWPLCPLPEVFPLEDPIPRPIRRFFLTAPGFCCSAFNFNTCVYSIVSSFCICGADEECRIDKDENDDDNDD